MERVLPFGKKLFLWLSFLLVMQSVPAQMLLDPVSHPKFVNELPIPAVLQPVGLEHEKPYYEVSIFEAEQYLLGPTATGQNLKTLVWGYGPVGEESYPGPTIEARSGEMIYVKWINNLQYSKFKSNLKPLETSKSGYNHLFAIDENIHWAGTDMGGELPGPNVSFNGIPTVTHLHGGHTEAASDGHPEAWYTPEHHYKGSNYYNNSGVFTYENSQEAATLWYHDHTIGITRLNVYAGLAGFYLLRDKWEDDLELPKDRHVVPDDPGSAIEHFEIPLVIQDRIFDTNGQLVYDKIPQFTVVNPSPEQPKTLDNSILPEMFGEFILVNGKAWPYLDVQPRKYRFRLLNGSDSRFYELKIPGVNFYQIGSDGGLLQAPLKRNIILIGPGERIDVVVDFSAPELWGQTLIMQNTARSPYPFGATANPQTTGQIMAFNVTTSLTNPDTSMLPDPLRNNPPTVSQSASNLTNPRKLVLFEQLDEYGRLLPSLGTAEEGAKTFMKATTEKPELGDTEVWDIYNTTADAHPIHLHLVHFEVIHTQKFDVRKSTFGTEGARVENPKIKLQGNTKPPAPENAGRKDTFIIYPGEKARVKAHFDKPGEYVWHCHILSHEDHDMMRPFEVIGSDNSSLASSLASIQTLSLSPETLESFVAAPNPVADQTEIRFRMNADSQVLVQVFNFSNQLIKNLYHGFAAAHQDYNVKFDRGGLPSGMYICKLSSADGRSYETKIVLE